MIASTPRLAHGILPDAVIRDPNANAYLIGVTLKPQLDAAGVQAWLTQVTTLIDQLQQSDGGGPSRATACVAFGASFFSSEGNPRFGLPASQAPAELSTPPALPGFAPAAAADVLFYVMSTSEAVVAAFERGLSTARTAAVAAVWVELGFQRKDRREQFGFLDGLRNVPTAERENVVFVDLDVSPEEPDWAAGGSYMAYIKIRQDLDAMGAKTEAEQQETIGRRKTDGSRLDLPEGTPVNQEGEFAATGCPIGAHVRKVGPRGGRHDDIKIFRRGVPYLTLNSDGSTDAGLQFVSFQCSLENFAVIFTRWMSNPNFPQEGAGQDALFANAVISIEKAGLFFVPARDDRYIGATIFDPPPPDPCATGKIVVHKQLVDLHGQPVLSELGGISFVLNDSSGQPVCSPFTTDSAGRAVSPPVPRNTALVLHEVSPPQGFQQPADQPVNLTSSRAAVTVVNQRSPEGPGPIYSG
jgi:deferrochelatase/peroxidase EfeB